MVQTSFLTLDNLWKFIFRSTTIYRYSSCNFFVISVSVSYKVDVCVASTGQIAFTCSDPVCSINLSVIPVLVFTLLYGHVHLFKS